MLINTLILIVGDFLPVLILISGLLVIYPQIRLISVSVIAGVIGAIFWNLFIDALSSSFDGAGVEVGLFSLQLMTYLSLVAATVCYLSRADRRGVGFFAGLAIAISISVNGSNFLLFISSYWSASSYQVIALAGLLATGICLSIAILLYSVLIELKQRFSVLWVLLLLGLHGAGQLSQSLHLLVQVDWINPSNPVWNWQQTLPQDQMLGLFFNALLGYQSKPGMTQIMVYAIAFVAHASLLWLGYRYNKEKR